MSGNNDPSSSEGRLAGRGSQSLQRASCAETAQEKQPVKVTKARWPKTTPQPWGLPTKSSTQPDAERANETPGIAAHAVQAHGGATQFFVSCLHRAGGQGRTVKIDRRVPQYGTATNTAGALALQPVSSDKAAAVLIATVTTRPQPHRWAVYAGAGAAAGRAFRSSSAKNALRLRPAEIATTPMPM
jgi:hypothetical protein